MSNSIFKRSQGYSGVSEIQQFVRTPLVMSEAMYQYAQDAKAPLFATSDFIPQGDLITNTEVIFPFVRDNCDVTLDDHYQNERPDDVELNVEPTRVKICKSYAIEKKVSREDMIMLGATGWNMYEDILSRGIKRNLQKITDRYFFNIAAASADPGNIIGSPGQPVDMTTADGFERVFRDVVPRLGCNEIIADNGSDRGNIVFGLPWCAYKGAVEFFKGIDTCSGDNVRNTGVIKTPFGFDFHFLKELPTYNGVQIGVWMDRQRMGFPYEWLYLEWNQVKTDMILSGKVVYDAYALDPKGVGLTYITV